MTSIDLNRLLEAMLAASPSAFGTSEPLTPEQTDDVARQIIGGERIR